MIEQVGFATTRTSDQKNVLAKHLLAYSKGCLFTIELSRYTNDCTRNIWRRDIVFDQFPIYDLMS